MPQKNELSLEEVKALAVGCRVEIHGEDQDGQHRVIECVVASRFNGAGKFLTYRVKGEIRKCAIKEYPEKYYTRGD